jgi:hypothetical protein
VARLNFNQEEPLKSSVQVPIHLADHELVGDQEAAQVRFAEWRKGKYRPLASMVTKIPLWLFLAGSLGIWLTIWGLVSSEPAKHLSYADFSQPSVWTLVLLGTVAVLIGGSFAQMIADRILLRRHLVSEGHSDELIVAIMFAKDGVLLGEDQGYLRFEGDSLFFEGLQTTFSIGNSRLSLVSRRPSIKEKLFYSGGIPPTCVTALEYKEHGSTYQFGLFPIGLSRDIMPQEITRRVRQWLGRPGSDSQIEVLPPRTPPPSALRDVFESALLPLFVAEAAALFPAFTYLVYEAGRTHGAHIAGRASVSTAPSGQLLTFFLIFVVGGTEFTAAIVVFSLVPLYRTWRRYCVVRSSLRGEQSS